LTKARALFTLSTFLTMQLFILLPDISSIRKICQYNKSVSQSLVNDSSKLIKHERGIMGILTYPQITGKTLWGLMTDTQVKRIVTGNGLSGHWIYWMDLEDIQLVSTIELATCLLVGRDHLRTQKTILIVTM
jgi:hypothetical protein